MNYGCTIVRNTAKNARTYDSHDVLRGNTNFFYQNDHIPFGGYFKYFKIIQDLRQSNMTKI